MLHLLAIDCVSYQEFNLLQTNRINQITLETSKNISTVNTNRQYSIVNGYTNTVINVEFYVLKHFGLRKIAQYIIMQ